MESEALDGKSASFKAGLDTVIEEFFCHVSFRRSKLWRELELEKYGSSIGFIWGDEKEVLKVLKLDPIFIPLHFYDFKKLKVNHYLASLVTSFL
jgi:hypothetical protein